MKKQKVKRQSDEFKISEKQVNESNVPEIKLETNYKPVDHSSKGFKLLLHLQSALSERKKSMDDSSSTYTHVLS
jgi:hypothetical protein